VTAESLAHALGGDGRSYGGEYRAWCPACERGGAASHKTPSLSVTDKHGVITFKCWSTQCPQDEIIKGLFDLGLWPLNGSGNHNSTTRPERRREDRALKKLGKEVARWNNYDSAGVLIAIHARYNYEDGSGKTFRWLLPDGRFSHGEIKSSAMPLFPAEILQGLADTIIAVLVEGEKTRDAVARALAALGRSDIAVFATVCGAGTTPDDATLAVLVRFSCVVAWPDNDTPGRRHMALICTRLLALGAKEVRVIDWVDAPERGDAADYEGPDEGLVALIEAARPFDPSTEIEKADDGPWAFVNADEFLAQGSGNDDAQFLVDEIVVCGGVTVLSAVRGLAKTHIAHSIAVAVARGGLYAGRPVKQGRVAIIDRDNPPREIRRRLRKWGAAGLGDRLKIITREKAASLTDQKAWAQFPAEDFDLIILDSLGSSMEGVSEQEGGESGKTIAPLLDIARRGPAVLALTNTTKDAAKIRGSGVIPDRLEILYELRDATAMKLDAKKETWLECLPPAGEQEWLNRSSRRKKRDAYRIAFIASKYRVNGEGDPFMLEIRLPDEGEWEAVSVTDVVEAEHAAAKKVLEDSLVKRGTTARAELERRIADGAKYSKTEAEDLVRDMGLKRDEAREVVNQALEDGTFTAEPDETTNGRGVKPKILKLVKEQQATL